MKTVWLSLAALLVSSACSSDSPSSPPRRFDGSMTIDSTTASFGDAPNALDVAPADSSAADQSLSLDASLASGDAASDASAAPLDAAVPDAASSSAPDAAEEPDASPDAVAMCGPIPCDCTFKGKKLSGGVTYVAAGLPADVRVRVVTNQLADLFVQEVMRPALAERCGQWRIDDFVPQLRVRKVNPGEPADFSIQYVQTLPGLPGMRF